MSENYVIPRAIPLRKGELCIVSESLIKRDFFSGQDVSPFFTFRSLRKRKADTARESQQAGKQSGEDDEVNEIGSVNSFVKSVLTFGSKHDNEVCLNIVDLKNPVSTRQVIRPGYSARRYLASWTKNVDDSTVKKWISDGKLSEQSIYQTNQFLPHIKKRLSDNMSDFPTPYRIVKQMLIAPGPLNEYSFFWSKKENSDTFDTGDIQVFSEVRGEVIRYHELEKNDQKGILSKLLVKSALNYGLKKTEETGDSSLDVNLMDAVRYLVDSETAALGHERNTRTQLPSLQRHSRRRANFDSSGLSLSGEHVGPEVELVKPPKVSYQTLDHLPQISESPLVSISSRYPGTGSEDQRVRASVPTPSLGYSLENESYRDEEQDQLAELPSESRQPGPMLFGSMPKAKGVWASKPKPSQRLRGFLVPPDKDRQNAASPAENKAGVIIFTEPTVDDDSIESRSPGSEQELSTKQRLLKVRKSADEARRLRTLSPRSDLSGGDFNASLFLRVTEVATPRESLSLNSSRRASAKKQPTDADNGMDFDSLDHESLMNALTRHAESVAERVLQGADAGVDIAADVQRAIHNVIAQKAEEQAMRELVDHQEDSATLSPQTLSDEQDNEANNLIKTALISAMTKSAGPSSDQLDSSSVILPDEIVDMLAGNSGVTPHDLVVVTDLDSGKKVITTKQWVSQEGIYIPHGATPDIDRIFELRQQAAEAENLSKLIQKSPKVLEKMIDDSDSTVIDMMFDSPNELKEILNKNPEKVMALLNSEQKHNLLHLEDLEHPQEHSKQLAEQFVLNNADKVIEMLKTDPAAMKEILHDNRDMVANVIHKKSAKLKKLSAKAGEAVVAGRSSVAQVPAVSPEILHQFLTSPEKLKQFLIDNINTVSSILGNPKNSHLISFPVTTGNLTQTLMLNIDLTANLVRESPDLLAQILQQKLGERQNSRLRSEVSGLERQKSKPVQHAEEFKVGQIKKTDELKLLYGNDQPSSQITKDIKPAASSKPAASTTLPAIAPLSKPSAPAKTREREGKGRKGKKTGGGGGDTSRGKKKGQKKVSKKKGKVYQQEEEKATIVEVPVRDATLASSRSHKPGSEDMEFVFVNEFPSDEDDAELVEKPPVTAMDALPKESPQPKSEPVVTQADEDQNDAEWERQAQEQLRRLGIKEQREAKRQMDAERRRRETERRRREADQRRRDEIAEAERREQMEIEMELQRQQKEEEAKERKRRENEERQRREEELEAAEARALQAKEREKREKERFLKQMEEMKRLKALEEERKKEEELARLAEEEERRKEEEAMLATMEDAAREEYLRLIAVEEERKRVEAEETRRRMEIEAAEALAKARELAEMLAEKREAEARRRRFQRGLLEEQAGHERYLGITHAFTFSYFDLLRWVGLDLPNAVRAQVNAM